MTPPNLSSEKTAYVWETSIHTDENNFLSLEFSLIFKDSLERESFFLPLYLPNTRYNLTTLVPAISIGIKKILLNATKLFPELGKEATLKKVRALFNKVIDGDYETKERKVESRKEYYSFPQLTYWLLFHKRLSPEEILALDEDSFEESWLKESSKKPIYHEYSMLDDREQFIKDYRDHTARLKALRRAQQGKEIRKKRDQKLFSSSFADDE